jgi:hypothetical protein
MDVPNPPETASAEKVLVSIGIQGINGVNSRTVLPKATFSDITGYELWGVDASFGTEEEKLFSITPESVDPDSGEGAVVAVDPGTWNFTLKAYKGEDLSLEGKTQAVLSSGQYAQIVFSLAPCIEGQGSARITITWPPSASVAAVQVIQEDGEETFLDILDNSVEYAEDHIPAGDYFISFRLTNSSGRLLAMVSEIMQIRSALVSEKTIDLSADDFNAVPNAPTNLIALVLESTHDTVRFMLEWNDNSRNETGFVLNDGTRDYNIEAGRNTYGPIDLAIGKTVTYEIWAVNDFGASLKAVREYTAATVSGSLLPAPDNIRARALSSQTIIIEWSPVVDVKGYKIYRTDAVNSDSYTRVGITDSDATISYTDTTGLAGNTTYYYRVIAYDDVNGGVWPEPVSALTYPAVPTGVRAKMVPENNVTITWDSQEGVTYTIYRSTVDNGGYTNISANNATAAYTDTLNAESTAYYYKVSASNIAGESEKSSAVEVYRPTVGGTVDYYLDQPTVYLYRDAACTEYTGYSAEIAAGGQWSVTLPWSTEAWELYFTIGFSITPTSQPYTFSSQPVGPKRVNTSRLDIDVNPPCMVLGDDVWIGGTINAAYTGGWFLLIPDSNGSITLDAERTATPLDPYMHLYDGLSKNQLTTNGDAVANSGSPDSRIQYSVEASHPYMVLVRGTTSATGTGSYRLRAKYD